ncbi:MAG: TfoX/Sxy family DNA transformation protein [Oleispira sp.]|nr:TfoX/Sxy family DNA transformation protein [Oleispira sp.]MBL4881035.1 TfoX/Sxy family DNA transformation protein [Oleispira sp.]
MATAKKKPPRLRDLKGFGPKSEEILARVDMHSVEQFLSCDGFELYAALKKTVKGTGLNSIYAILGAQQDVHWQEIARTQKYEILLRLDDMGLAPEKASKKKPAKE